MTIIASNVSLQKFHSHPTPGKNVLEHIWTMRRLTIPVTMTTASSGALPGVTVEALLLAVEIATLKPATA